MHLDFASGAVPDGIDLSCVGDHALRVIFFVSLTEIAECCIFSVDASGISKLLAEDAEVEEDTVLSLAVSDGKVVATPVRRRKLSLTQLLAKVNRQTLHTEVEIGSPVGREIW